MSYSFTVSPVSPKKFCVLTLFMTFKIKLKISHTQKKNLDKILTGTVSNNEIWRYFGTKLGKKLWGINIFSSMSSHSYFTFSWVFFKNLQVPTQSYISFLKIYICFIMFSSYHWSGLETCLLLLISQVCVTLNALQNIYCFSFYVTSSNYTY